MDDAAGAARGPAGEAVVAAVDIGTHAALLLVARGAERHPIAVVERSTVTRLGAGVAADGRLQEDAIARTVGCLQDYARIAAEAGATVAAWATSAARDAANVDTLLDAAQTVLGVRPRVLSGHEEARATFHGALVGLETTGPVSVVDVGGGSTEIIVGSPGGIVHATSVDVGAVRLTEGHVREHPIADAERDAMGLAAREALGTGLKGRPLVGCGGTITTLAALAYGIDPYDPRRVHGATLPRGQLEELVIALAGESLEARARRPGLSLDRADVIVAGAVIWLELVRRAEAERILVSARGLRWGLARTMLAKAPAASPGGTLPL